MCVCVPACVPACVCYGKHTDVQKFSVNFRDALFSHSGKFIMTWHEFITGFQRLEVKGLIS